MINTLVNDMKMVWKKVGLPLNVPLCSEQCSFCKKSESFKNINENCALENILQIACEIPNCPRMVAAAM